MNRWNYVVLQKEDLKRPEELDENMNIIFASSSKEDCETEFKNTKVEHGMIKILYLQGKKTLERKS